MMKVTLAAALALLLLPQAAAPAGAQEKNKDEARRPKRVQAEAAPTPETAPKPSAADASAAQAEGAGQPGDEEAAVAPVNTFMSSYRLGPEDVISITVFGLGLERYSKQNITIPPDGRIDYYFIKGGLKVVGKTRQEVEEEITRHLDEYIIDPRVTVTLEKAQSHRYGVLGEVAKPGIFVMSRRLSVYEAVLDAGGILRTGKKQVVLLRWDANRMVRPQIIDVAAIERGKAPDNLFLQPGDQIFVPSNKWKTVDKIMQMIPVISFARIFTGGF